jgi:Domain of unknown function (DUF4124)
MCKPKIIGAGFIFALALSLSAEAKLCKWVDGNGDIHYGDVLPPAYASKDTSQAGKAEGSGGCNETMSPNTVGATEDEAAKKIAAKKEMEEKKRRANALRNSYSSEKEIDLALERNSALINARIEAYNVQLKSAQDTLDDLKKYVDNRSKEGKAIPQSAYEDISETEARVSRLQSERAKSEEELKAMKARFEEDKILYRKIIVLTPVNDAEENIETSYPVSEDAGYYPEYRPKSKRAKKSRTQY